MGIGRVPAASLLLVLAAAPALGAERTPADRGKQALLTRAFNPPTIPLPAYQNAWRYWGGDLKAPPADYDRGFREHYGLHPAPYPNGGLPMGLREAKGLLSKGLTNDCLICHGGSVLGQSYVGLPNSTLDYQALYEDLARAAGYTPREMFRFSNVRGTTESGAFAVFLLGYRDPDLGVRTEPLDLKLCDTLCEDAPAWWLLKKKKTMYHTGSGDTRSVRALMQFMLTPLNTRAAFEREEATFRDIREYLLSLEPPKYPFPIDEALAARGEAVFRENCARCHGTYGAKWTYPNRIVPIAEIGTDRTRFDGLSREFARHYNASWFAQEQDGWFAPEYPGQFTAGYQAPPLDGIWATAPYFHNGAVPTVYHVLNSNARPRIFTRSYRTDAEAYDPVKLGWKVQVLDDGPDPRLPGFEGRKVYDTRQPGRSNGGHTFGDRLTEDERMAVIEYLKKL